MSGDLSLLFCWRDGGQGGGCGIAALGLGLGKQGISMAEMEVADTDRPSPSMEISRFCTYTQCSFYINFPSIWLSIGVEIAMAITIQIEIYYKGCAKPLLTCMQRFVHTISSPTSTYRSFLESPPIPVRLPLCPAARPPVAPPSAPHCPVPG